MRKRNAGDVVDRLPVNRHARKRMLLNGRRKLLQCQRPWNGENIGPRRHDFTHRLVAELHHGPYQFPVRLLENALFFACFEKGIHRFGRRVILGLLRLFRFG